MRFEYILLICTFILPLIYKLWYWQSIFESENNEIKRFWSFLKTKQGSEALLHFWIFLEIPVACMTIIPFFNPPFEVFLYNIVFYFGILYNIFVIGKIARKKIYFPKINSILLVTVLFLVFDWVGSYMVDTKYLYVFLMCSLLLMPLYFIAAIFVQKYCNIKLLKNYK